MKATIPAKPARPRRKIILLICGLVVLLVYPLYRVLDAFAPLHTRSSVCHVCSLARSEQWICGCKVWDWSSTNPHHAWFNEVIDSPHTHQWKKSENLVRTNWGGERRVGCCFFQTPTGAIFNTRKTGGEWQARAALKNHFEQTQSP